MKKQKRQYLFKKIFTSTLLFSGIFLVIFNINFGFLQNNSNDSFIIKKCYAVDELGAAKIQSSIQPRSKGRQISAVGEALNVKSWVAAVIYGILKAIAIMISGLVRVIEYSLSPEFVNKLFDSSAIYTGWKTVRDTLNIMFIFFLLFSG